MATCEECGGLGEVVEPVPRREIRTHRGKLERGHRRTWLIVKIAEGLPYAALAEALDVSDTAVKIFARRHAEEIIAQRQAMHEQLVSLWVAQKIHRLAAMQQDVDDINEVVEGLLAAAQPDANPMDPTEARAHPELLADLPTWFRTKTLILRAIAEELGQLPARVQVQVAGTVATYRLEGADLDKV